MPGNSKEAQIGLIVRAVDAHITCGRSYFDDFHAPIFYGLSQILITIQTVEGIREIHLEMGGKPDSELEFLLPFAQIVLQAKINK